MFGAFMDAAMSIPQIMHAEEMQNDAQGFNRQEAIDQRDWTERMSNTQYQRAATDASAAGLNRILAMRQGGNTAGGGGTASSAAGAGQVRSNFMGGEINSAQIANIDMDTRKKDAERSLASQHYNESQARTDLINEQWHTQKETTHRERAAAATATATAKGAKLEGEIDETKYGEIMRYINRSIRAITGGSSAVERLNR